MILDEVMNPGLQVVLFVLAGYLVLLGVTLIMNGIFGWLAWREEKRVSRDRRY